MSIPPALLAGFVRITLLLDRASTATPGDLARATGLEPDDLGAIWIDLPQAFVDVRAEKGSEARNRLDRFGITQVTLLPDPQRQEWRWLRLAIGRNHGLTISLLRRLLDKHQAGPLGRIKISNTHTLVGLRGDLIQAVHRSLAEAVVNGCRVRPELPGPDEVRMSPRFDPGRDRQ